MSNEANCWRLSRREILGSAVAVLGFGVVTTGASAEEEPDVKDVLSKASQRLADIESLHFTLEIEGETFIDDTEAIQLLSAEGDLSRPDKVAVEFKVSLFGAGNVSIKMITIGERSWTTDLITGNWGDAPPEFGYNPTILYDNQDGLGPVMGKLENAEIAGTEKLDDRETIRITGSATSAVIDPLTAGTMTGDDVALEIWIDSETYDLHKVRVTEPESDDKENPATWELNLSEFNQKVTIEPPV